METGSKVGSEKLTLTVGPAGYSLFIDDPNWSLNVGDKYDAVAIIGDQSWGGKATVYATTGVAMQYPFDTGFGPSFVSGTRFDFQIGKFGRSLSLNGSAKALQLLGDCLTTYMPERNPFGAPSNNASTVSSNPFK
jgi:hypothetical protein